MKYAKTIKSGANYFIKYKQPLIDTPETNAKAVLLTFVLFSGVKGTIFYSLSHRQRPCFAVALKQKAPDPICAGGNGKLPLVLNTVEYYKILL
ncbi:MAG TPA: hypothetical protein PKD70_11030 [Saprospiraceae bacterium]|nr:hypothetical protein [Saprospiraceae bacterium]HMP14404.1 hypothetical protein [Saprospiraceae bacterium]